MRVLSALALNVVVIAGCASQRPVLYPNQHVRNVGSGTADRDIDECMRRAEAYVSSNGQVGSAVEGAATGAATSATIGAAAGAAGGGAAGATRGLIHGLFGNRGPSAVYKNFVNRCLREKGYDPIGWD
jgi:outer membrane lipoprotein SlyB